MKCNKLGINGERMAADFILKKGYSIREMNFTWGKGEIDIIASQGSELVIIEVKTRQTNFFGAPSDAVTRSKQRQIIKIANRYVKDHDLNVEVRFDVISIVVNQFEKKIDQANKGSFLFNSSFDNG